MADADASQVDTAKDFGTSPQAVASRWISELDLSEKSQAPWITKGRRIVRLYENERKEAEDAQKRRFALLWANIQTLAPAVYARTPTAVVGRRWKDGDPIARTASEVIERALNFQIDVMDFADMMTSIRDEFLLVGRGQVWVRYVPHMAPSAEANEAAEGGPGDADKAGPVEAPDGEITNTNQQYEEVIWEEALCDHVHWEDFGTNPARTWSEVRFVWRRVFMTRDELVKRFGDKGKACPLDWKTGEDGSTEKDGQFNKAAVYEIWDKVSKTAFWVCKSYSDAPLDQRDDPLGLRNFFPCPRPLLGTCGPDSIIPTPDYVYYESQAKEINTLTARIGLLTDALKVRGFYAATEGQRLQDMFAAETNTLIPVDSWAALADRGGMKGLVEWFPVDMVALTLKGCIETRQQMLTDVFQITGIADIMRGDVDPNETATATNAKTNWGSSRVRDKQKELGRFVRDLLCIMGEIISTKFSTDTLSKMTGVQLLASPQEKQLIQQQMAMQQQMAQPARQQPAMPPHPAPQPPPVDPKMVRMLNDPTWQEVEAMLHDNAMRSFRIDIETDSTIEPDDQEEKQRRVEFVEAVATYLEKTMAVVQLSPEMLPVVVEGLKFLVRGFRVGREMEDVIEMALDKLQAKAEQAQAMGPQQNPAEQAKAQADQMKGQAALMGAQADQTRAQNDVFKAHADAQLTAAEIHVQGQKVALEHAHEQSMQGQSIAADMQKAVMSAASRRLVHDINSPKPMDVPTP